MAGGTQVIDRVDAGVTALIREVDSMRDFVVYNIGRRHFLDPDVVMQQIRESVWRRSSTYDPELGTPNAFVFGITRNVVRNELRRRIPPYTSSWDQFESLVEPDALTLLVERYDVGRWVSLVAEFVSQRDWAVLSEIALSDGDSQRVMHACDLSPRSVRTIRDRVFLVASTVRGALAAVDANLPITGPVIVRCLPDQRGLREVARMLGDGSEVIAKRLNIHPGSARARVAQAKRLLSIAHAVMRQELAA